MKKEKQKFEFDGIDEHMSIEMPSKKNPNLDWKRSWEETPIGHPSTETDVIVRIYGLASITASEYEEYKVVKWYEKKKEFGEFKRDRKGYINYVSYDFGNESNMPYPYKKPFITHWAYFDIPDFSERYGGH